MGRWEGDAEGRLRAAAMALFVERGYEQTTVADIAERAGLTARTFFRYFADKPEVLFNGAGRLQQRMVEALDQSPAHATALQAVAAALFATAEFFGDQREFARQRRAVIEANAELRERELHKLAALSGALADALRKRGFGAVDAQLAAEMGIAVFRVSFGLWVEDGEARDFNDIVRDSLASLATLVGRT